MDYMELERERGITITSAATSVRWNDATINVIDTPGHVDFTVEVERSLRVLDGAVLVLCAVGGVQSQSLTIDRQMRRYHVPRVAFINKMDRTGANPESVVRQLHEKLDCDARLMQLPIGRESAFEGVIDLVSRKALYFDGEKGETVRVEAIPANYAAAAAEARREMLEALAMYSDELMELLLAEDPVPEQLIHRVVKAAVLNEQFTPVFLGTAFKNQGVQPLLDAVVRYLPNPIERESFALRIDDEAKIPLVSDPEKPTVAMAFKIVEDPYGALTFMRIYQGSFKKGESYYNQRNGKKERFGRILRMHADQREDVDRAEAGDIVAVIGVDAASGDTYCSAPSFCTLESMFVPEPVIQIAIAPATRDGADRLSKALHRFRREDPTLHVTTDQETGETLLSGMGELHLDVYIERLRREFNVQVEVGAPKVSYREAPTALTEFNIRHKKQTGGSGQFAHIVGTMGPLSEEHEGSFLFEEKVVGGRVPKQYIPAVAKGFKNRLAKGPIAAFPVVGLHVVLADGSYHEVDSSEMAFQTAAHIAMREVFPRTKPVLLEPVMKIEVECPSEFQGTVVGDLTTRRGMIMATETVGSLTRLEGEIPLAEAFGYSTSLRGMTQGQGTFTLEFSRYKRLPAALERTIIEERRKEAVLS